MPRHYEHCHDDRGLNKIHDQSRFIGVLIPSLLFFCFVLRLPFIQSTSNHSSFISRIEVQPPRQNHNFFQCFISKTCSKLLSRCHPKDCSNPFCPLRILKDCRVIALDVGALISGAKYRGEFEERLKVPSIVEMSGETVRSTWCLVPKKPLGINCWRGSILSGSDWGFGPKFNQSYICQLATKAVLQEVKDAEGRVVLFIDEAAKIFFFADGTGNFLLARCGLLDIVGTYNY